MNRINVTRSSMPSYEEYCDEIKDIWDSHWMTNMGVKHNQFEEELAKRLNVRMVSLCSNGHMALENAIEVLDMPKGGEIITTPFTFASTTHAICRKGYSPIFCDIKKDDYTIDENKIESLITENTVGIVPVHVYGNICNVEKIKEIADKHQLKIVYDAAHAFGVTYKGQSVASFGDLSIFSFHATKVFNTIEGGAICSDRIDYKEKLHLLRDFGISGDSVELIGGNAKMNEFQAAMGLCNLRHLSSEINKRKEVVKEYRKLLGNTPGIVICKEQPDVISNYSYFPVVFDGYKYSRDMVLSKLAENGIGARKYFYPLTSDFKCYESFDPMDTPIAKHISEHVITLPLYSDLSLEDVYRICSIILE